MPAQSSPTPSIESITQLKQIVLGASSEIEEGVKWNAPSFRTREWFATVNLREQKGVSMILHFGAKKNAISESGVAIDDPAGLLKWLGKDRAMVHFRDTAELQASKDALQAVLRECIRHV